MKILLADDEETIRWLLAFLFEQQGWEVIALPNGSQVQAQAEKEQPDLILLDMDMPEVNGLQALQRLKASAQTREIPVMMCSGSVDPAVRRRAEAGGVGCYLEKPVDLDVLLDKIYELIGAASEA